MLFAYQHVFFESQEVAAGYGRNGRRCASRAWFSKIFGRRYLMFSSVSFAQLANGFAWLFALPEVF